MYLIVYLRSGFRVFKIKNRCWLKFRNLKLSRVLYCFLPPRAGTLLWSPGLAGTPTSSNLSHFVAISAPPGGERLDLLWVTLSYDPTSSDCT